MSAPLLPPRRLSAAQRIALTMAPEHVASEVRASQTSAIAAHTAAKSAGVATVDGSALAGRALLAGYRYEHALVVLAELYLDDPPRAYRPGDWTAHA